ncbi:pentatricopeptide repeat-containing protein At3g09650, chloroplastic [Phoenix dactylifera]|uniref:Pentatricopeptide repeat-containing protein At3g09650, chloroplastic n=1 Tax=Phoenix dactylifera TaxID=42345 RepID=A0A8B7BR66_PHODC|nr:pentatricopeptide repeat-containing protein At3g09650, chloroplastic [Phoenix dactylifera]
MQQPSMSSAPLHSRIQVIPSTKPFELPNHSTKPLHHHHPPIRAQPTSNQVSFPILNLTPGDGTPTSSHDIHLLSLLRQRKTEEAYQAYTRCPHLPSSTCLSRLVAQLSYQNTPAAFTRAQDLVRRLRDERQLHRLDANSLGLLAAAAARSGATLYAVSVVRTMLRSGYLPHVKAWSAVVSRLAAAPDDGPAEALRLFDAVLRRVRRIPGDAAADARPDTAAFNAALNAAANLGDVRRFAQLFDGMPEFGAQPDVLTYNVLIKMLARAERKDLLVFALERIIQRALVPCITTLHSLVAAYVGFGDLETGERLVQAMREGRRDLCSILRDSNADEPSDRSDKEAHALLEKLVAVNSNSGDANGDDDLLPLLPKTYTPDSRIYTTLMKGYMKDGRVDDVVRMVQAMQQEADPSSHPDHVTYTTVISALVKVGAMDRARSVLAEMARARVPANRITYNVLLKGYCQKLQLNKAKELAREMSEKAGVEPNVVSYNILIDGCILVDDSAGALAYFNEMRERGIAPSKVSYTTLMKAFALSGQPKLAHKVFDEMDKDSRVKVDRVAWNMLVEGYCRLGFVEEAKKLMEKMKERGCQPDVATYGSLANGIALARKPGEALLLWNEVKERCKASPPLRPDEGLLDALADVCVRAAFFKKALEIVACMEENGISPNKTKYKRIYVELHSRMFTSKHASQARQDRRRERKRAAEAFKFWLGLPNSYYGSEWRLEPVDEDDYGIS